MNDAPQTTLEAPTPPPELAEALADIELDILPPSKAQRRPVNFAD